MSSLSLVMIWIWINYITGTNCSYHGSVTLTVVIITVPLTVVIITVTLTDWEAALLNQK